MTIPFTDREMERAWRENLVASRHANRSNAHRLLLFYAVECGLKALILKKSGHKYPRTDDFESITDAEHNLNKLMDALSMMKSFRLPEQIRMKDIKDACGKQNSRYADVDKINQMWRYGGRATGAISDVLLEEKLKNVCNWIEREMK
jgi:HEPN domain-containing protein